MIINFSNGQKTIMAIEKIDGTNFTAQTRVNISPPFGKISEGDPLHKATMDYFKSYMRIMPSELVINIRTLPILISKSDNRYFINGKSYSQSIITNALARVLYKSTNEEDKNKLLSSLYQHLSLPENITYALENRVPYEFYNRYEQGIVRLKVRLNVKQIGKKEFALEISDGVWGNISLDNLNSFVNWGRKGHKRGKWAKLSPKSLYLKLIGREPNDGELKLMVEFLKQNRQNKMVQNRAKELMENIAEIYSDRIFYKEGRNRYYMYVKGQIFDWKLVSRGKNNAEHCRQGINTYLRLPNIDRDEDITMDWNGPICIDNMMSGSSMGDQMVARAMSFLNDKIAAKRINTVSNYFGQEEVVEAAAKRRMTLKDFENDCLKQEGLLTVEEE